MSKQERAKRAREKRARYPADWPQIARRVKDDADWRCEFCGTQCYKPGEKVEDGRLVLTVSHINHIESDCSRENLRALCAPCHLRYDALMHAQRAKARRVLEMAQRGQFVLVDVAAYFRPLNPPKEGA